MNIAGQFNSLTAAVLPAPSDPGRRPHVNALFSDYERNVVTRTNQFFAWLLALQWVFAVVFVAFWSPLTWAGRMDSLHPHVYAAFGLGGLLCVPPILLMRLRPHDAITRHVVAIAQMGFSALLIDVTGGRIETHFHVFGSLAFLALYRDWRILITATVVVALDHLVRGLWLPETVYGTPFASIWRTAEHAVWVIFEVSVLTWACLVSRREMWEICLRHDQNKCLLASLEQRVRERTRELEAAMAAREEAAASLRRSEERHRELIDNVPIGILETTQAGQVRYLNPHACSIIGLSGPEEIGKVDLTSGHIFHLPDRQRFWKQLTERKVVQGFEVTLTRVDGREIHVVLNARLKPNDDQGGPICESTMEDVTERKLASQKLEGLHRQLVEASRQAGRADVATGVLHNVGNVLTSVNLIVHDVRDRLRASGLAYLHRVVETIQRERERISDFLANDPAGKAIPDFLVKLDARLTTENESLRGDVETLVGHFEHIRQIIVVQQSSARMFGVVEAIAPSDLVEDALKVNFDSFGRHGVTLRKRFGIVPPARINRHKVMQILVNLLKNAKDSILAGNGLERRITVSITSRADGKVAIAVEDTGAGIPPENMVRIFQHGFTTKKDGHGFGLHSCVLAAREMAGDLTAFSEGPGHGATFTLVLPTAA